MNPRISAIGTLIVLALLACSPQAIVREIIGDSATTPTRIALAEPTPSTAATLSNPTVPAQTATAPATSATLASTPALPTNTPPPPLALRTDLPALALRDWPRPANDNGRCMHFLPVGYFSARDFDIQIPRLVGLQIRWTLALYSDENQLRLAAPRFKNAGIVPIWRKTLRAHQRYASWGRDIEIMNQVGLPPYIQIYNEPDNGDEWDGRDVNRDAWVASFVQAARDVYNAGGYVGLQVLDVDWIRAVIQSIKAQRGEKIFTRMFFIPHPYAVNHPPNYVDDEIGVLGFRQAAEVFQQELGFIPPFIAGEGGWKFGSDEDNRFPKIDDPLHARYHVELFNWFRLGKLSDGAPLPDYLFAFCPWILAGQLEGAAWYDSFEGERALTIAEVKKIPIVTRKFSWDKK
ncbi:MAG: hypothetical protein HY327_08480 [Chloroflexi bacterium]|nr:hypothetical protein [Chloroflexota bacterium]